MSLGARIIAENLFAIQREASNWQQAVKLGCNLLEEKGYITTDYYQSILKVVDEHGPYFVILPGVAMPHSRPEAGAIETGCSLVTLKEPVVFGHDDNDPVSLIFTMSAKSTEELNEGILIEIMNLLDDGVLVEQLINASSEDELKTLLCNR